MRWPWVRRYWYDRAHEASENAWKHAQDVRRENTLLLRVLGLPEMYPIYEEWLAARATDESVVVRADDVRFVLGVITVESEYTDRLTKALGGVS